MIGSIGGLTVAPDQRDRVIALMLSGADTMAGCIAYIVAGDAQEENVVWVTEVWETSEHHQASLTLPAVRNAIEQAMPLIAAFDTIATTEGVRFAPVPDV